MTKTTTTTTITIQTAIHEGINGGGTVETAYEWNAGPRNLIKAIRTLESHRREMDQAYGNIGHAGSWIEIAGNRIHPFDLDEIDPDNDYYDADHRARCGLPVTTATQRARELIDDVIANGYDIDQRYPSDWIDEAYPDYSD